MDFVPPAKQKELKSALKNIDNNIIILNGPPGSSKTYTLIHIASAMGIKIEYMENIENFKNATVTKNSICLTDIDTIEYYNMHKDKIISMKKLVIETRMLPFIGKGILNSVTINFNKPTDNKIKKIFGLTQNEIEVINGNLHLSLHSKYCSNNSFMSIYHFLGKIFYSKIEKIEEAVNKSIPFGKEKLIGYLKENSGYFMDLENIFMVYDAISLEDINDEAFYEYLIFSVIKAKKIKPQKFFSFKTNKESYIKNSCINRKKHTNYIQE